MTVDEIYTDIGQNMANNLADTDWQEAVLYIHVLDQEHIQYNLEYQTANGETKTAAMNSFPNQAVAELYSLMLEGESSRWNQAAFRLQGDGSFSMDFDWEDPK